MTNNKKLLFLVTEDWYFWSHRLPLAKEAQKRGYEVVIATRAGCYGKRLCDLGFKVIPLHMSRGSINPYRELLALKEVIHIYCKEKPDIVHNVSMKPVLYGSIAARFSRTRHVVNAITGMGFIFTSASLKALLIRPFVYIGLRLLFNKKGYKLIVQNKDDFSLFKRRYIINGKTISLIRGSGVDTDVFKPASKDNDMPVIALVSRMLWDKGVGEFVEAARILKKSNIKGRFILVGDTDLHNSARIMPEQLRAWSREGVVEWHGYCENIFDIFCKSDIACLPSYREGLPKVLLEAASCGLPIVACDVPGCREIVRNGENGLLVPVKDSERLAYAIKELIDNKDLRRDMGKRGRDIAVNEFAIERIVSDTIKVYEELVEG